MFKHRQRIYLQMLFVIPLLLLLSSMMLAAESIGSDGRIETIAIDPHNPQIIYVGASSGMYKSTDGGRRWELTGAVLNDEFVHELAIDPKNSKIIYANAGHILKSIDSGITWSAENNWRSVSCWRVSKIIIDPSDPSIIYTGKCKSIDGGLHWSVMNNGLPDSYAYTIAIDPKRPSILYAGTQDGVFKSTDSGNIWKDTDSLLSVEELVVDPENSKIIYAVFGHSFYKSIDGGVNWKRIDIKRSYADIDADAEDVDVRCIGISASSKTIYVGTNHGVYNSKNRGKSWRAPKNRRETLVISIAVDPNNSNIVYKGTENGIYKSANGGKDWWDINEGIPVRE